MTLRLVVRQSLRESWRNRELPGIVILFVVMFGLLGLVYGQFMGSDAWTVDRFMLVPLYISALFVPMIGIVLGNNLVAGPREDGRLRLVLGQPLSRSAFVTGQYLAKATILTLAVGLGGLAFVAVALAVGPPLDVGQFGLLTLLTIGLGLAYLGIAVAVSTVYRTTDWTTFTMFSVFLVLVLVWRLVPAGALFVTNGFSFPESAPAWTTLAEGLSPSVAHEFLFDLLIADAAISTPDGTGSPALYLGVLLAWIVAVPLAATWRFRSRDL